MNEQDRSLTFNEPQKANNLFSLLDPPVWAAHKGDLCCRVNVSDAEWELYWRETRKESRGYWHGATGRIFERLGLPQWEWEEFRRLHNLQLAECLGDSSMDLSYLVTRERGK